MPDGPIAATDSLEWRDNTIASMICIIVIADVDNIIGPASLSRLETCFNIECFYLNGSYYRSISFVHNSETYLFAGI